VPKKFDWIIGIFLVGLLLLLTGTGTGHGEFIVLSAPFFLAAALLTLLNRIP